MDKSWLSKPRASIAYRNGVKSFLDFAFARAAEGNEILCPCVKCKNIYWETRNVVNDHLVCHGFVKGYSCWTFHGEKEVEDSENEDVIEDDDMYGLLSDLLASTGSSEPDEQTKHFFTLLEDVDQELYPGCEKFSKLSFTIRIYLLKCLHGWSNSSFDSLLSLLTEAFPEAKIPKSFVKMKTMIKGLGLNYRRIDACPNDCMLYDGDDDSKLDKCKICDKSRYKNPSENKGDSTEDGNFSRKPVGAKIFRYFPLIPRLQRLFMSSKTAGYMRWHDEKHIKDGKLRHPADGQAWKDFNNLHPDFAAECRNVRIGIASDGFNPFRTMTTTHSTWPVVVAIYNLPSWMCMKPEYLVLSSIIPGPKSPGNDIDVYLRPMVKELKTLWQEGVLAYDAHIKQTFNLRACLMWTISDFPGYAMLSGWSTKGTYACPNCNYDTCSQSLRNSHKMCYMGSRRFLAADHEWRRDKRYFNGETEFRPRPKPLSGSMIKEKLSGFTNDFGKRDNKKGETRFPLSKLSIFFELPYWEHNKLRHNLDVMHIEKNVFDNVIGTLLDIQGKTKDHLKARLDLQEMGIRKKLHPKASANPNKSVLPRACFSLTNHEKDIFCQVLKGAKVPDGCASNISQCVNLKERKLSGYKSHDAHFIMQYLLPVAARKTLAKNVAISLIRLGRFFKAICRKVITLSELDQLQAEIVETLCQLERIFPPSFFDVMVHLPIHLVEEIRLGGPVQTRWMYPIERFLGVLKDFVKNRNQPEASIAEGNSAKECLIFCSRYMSENGDTRFTQPSRNHEGWAAASNSGGLFPIVGRPIGGKKNGKGDLIQLEDEVLTQARLYVIINCEDNLPEVSAYINEYAQSQTTKRKRSKYQKEKSQSQNLVEWLESRVEHDNTASPGIKHLASGPNPIAQSFSGYLINGYRFHTLRREKNLKTQSSGVTLTALTSSYASSKDKNPVLADASYYGAIEEIIQLDYYSNFRVVLFKCKWFEWEKDDCGFTRVNFRRLISLNDPFVMADQVKQGFYVQDPVQQNWHYWMETLPRDLFDMKVDSSVAEFASTSAASRVGNIEPVVPIDNNEELQWSRDDVEGITVDNPVDAAAAKDVVEEGDAAAREVEVTNAEDQRPSEATMPYVEEVEDEYISEDEITNDKDASSSEAETSSDEDDYFD